VNGVLMTLLAAVCRVCPLCVCARRWPNSRFAEAVRRIERFCPACRAYAKLKQEIARKETNANIRIQLR